MSIRAAGTVAVPTGNVPKKCGAVSTSVAGIIMMGYHRQHTCNRDERHEGKHHCSTCQQDWVSQESVIPDQSLIVQGEKSGCVTRVSLEGRIRGLIFKSKRRQQ